MRIRTHISVLLVVVATATACSSGEQEETDAQEAVNPQPPKDDSAEIAAKALADKAKAEEEKKIAEQKAQAQAMEQAKIAEQKKAADEAAKKQAADEAKKKAELAEAKSKQEAAEKAALELQKSRMYKVVNASVLAVRSGPGLKYPVVRSLKLGEMVQEFDNNSKWMKISANTNEWASRRYLSKAYPTSIVPATVMGTTCEAQNQKKLIHAISKCDSSSVQEVLGACPGLKDQAGFAWHKYRCK